MPATRWLQLYSERFDVVEVNTTFYRLPTRRTVEQWVRETPDDFIFAVKASRYLTHVKRLRELPQGLRRLRERIAPLEAAGKLGPVLWQLPPNFERDDVRLAMALDELGPGRHAFEFRHPSWFTEEVEALLRAHDAAFVVADSRRRPLPVPARTASWTYLRFHDGRGRRGNYSERQLDKWAEGLRRERGEGYVFFNNDWESFAVANALRLRKLLDAGGRRPRPRRHRAAPALSARG